MKHNSAYTNLLLAVAAILMTACTGDTAENNFNNEINADGVITLNALRIETDGDPHATTRTTSDGNTWVVGDCVYIRNANTSSQYAADRKWRRYIYRANGLFTPYSNHVDSVLHFTGTNDYIEAVYRGDDQRGGGNFTDEPVANGTGCKGYDNPFTITDDQTTAAKLQTCDYLYTKQKVVYLANNPDAQIGAVKITLKHKVSWININVTVGANHTFNYVRVNNGSDKMFKTAKPTPYNTVVDNEYNIDLVGTTRYPDGTYIKPLCVTPGVTYDSNTGKYTPNDKGTYNFKMFVIPQSINTTNEEDNFIEISVTNTADGQEYKYHYDMPHNSTYVKNRTYTYNLGLTKNHYRNVFTGKSEDDDALNNSDLGKILCSDGSLVPTVAEAKDKGYTPLGILVQFSGDRATGYTGLCMSYEDVAQNTSLVKAAYAVSKYKTIDGKPNPGNLNWCSDWFIPTLSQWESVMMYDANGNSAINDYNSTGAGTKGVYYASQNYLSMLAVQKNPDNTDYSTNTSAASNHTTTYVDEDDANGVPIKAAQNTDYWTSIISDASNAKAQRFVSTGGEPNKSKGTTANTRAFFYFSSKSNPDPTSYVSSNCKLYNIRPLLETTTNDIGKVIIVDEDKKGYVYTYNNAISTDDYPKGQYLDGYALLASLSSVTGMSGTINNLPKATGESGKTHGLAVRLVDIGNYAWRASDSNSQNNENDSYFYNYYSYNNSIGYLTNEIMSESPGGYAKTNYIQSTSYPAFYQCWQRTEALPTASGATDHWFLPNIRQWSIVLDVAGIKANKSFRASNYLSYASFCSWASSENAKDVVDYFFKMFTNVGGNAMVGNNYYWSSSESQYFSNGWYYYGYGFYPNTGSGLYIHCSLGKTSAYPIRPFYAF